MNNVLGKSVADIDWKKYLKTRYKDLLPKVIRWRGYSETDPTAWVNITDTINDIILDVLYGLDNVNIGDYVLGKIGSVTNTPTSRFAKRYPALFKAINEIHAARLESDLSHPIVKATKKPTRWIKYNEMNSLNVLMRKGYLEMKAIMKL